MAGARHREIDLSERGPPGGGGGTIRGEVGDCSRYRLVPVCATVLRYFYAPVCCLEHGRLLLVTELSLLNVVLRMHAFLSAVSGRALFVTDKIAGLGGNGGEGGNDDSLC